MVDSALIMDANGSFTASMALQQEVNAGDTILPIWTYRAILEQLQEGVIITSLGTNFRRMNHAAAKLYGYDDPRQFERSLPKLSSLFELQTYPGRKPIPYKDWPISKLRHGAKQVSQAAYVRRKDIKHELIVQYDGTVVNDPEGNRPSPSCGSTTSPPRSATGRPSNSARNASSWPRWPPRSAPSNGRSPPTSSSGQRKWPPCTA